MDLSILSWLCLHTGEPGCSHRREHAFSAYFTWHVICTGAWCVYGYRSTSKPNYVTFCMCAKINTTQKKKEQESGIWSPCLYLCQINKWQNTLKNTSHFISMLNLTPLACTQAEFQSHTHIVLIFWRYHAVTPHYCTLAIKSEAGPAIWSRLGWHLASVPLRDLYAAKFSKKKWVKRYECEDVLSRLGLSRWSKHFSQIPSLFLCSLFFNDLCVTLIIQMFKLPGPHERLAAAEKLVKTLTVQRILPTPRLLLQKLTCESLQTERAEMISTLRLRGRLSPGLTRC